MFGARPPIASTPKPTASTPLCPARFRWFWFSLGWYLQPHPHGLLSARRLCCCTTSSAARLCSPPHDGGCSTACWCSPSSAAGCDPSKWSREGSSRRPASTCGCASYVHACFRPGSPLIAVCVTCVCVGAARRAAVMAQERDSDRAAAPASAAHRTTCASGLRRLIIRPSVRTRFRAGSQRVGLGAQGGVRGCDARAAGCGDSGGGPRSGGARARAVGKAGDGSGGRASAGGRRGKIQKQAHRAGTCKEAIARAHNDLTKTSRSQAQCRPFPFCFISYHMHGIVCRYWSGCGGRWSRRSCGSARRTCSGWATTATHRRCLVAWVSEPSLIRRACFFAMRACVRGWVV